MKALLFAEGMRIFGRPRLMRQKRVQTFICLIWYYALFGTMLLNQYQAITHNEVIFIVFGRKLGNKTRKSMTDNEVFNYC